MFQISITNPMTRDTRVVRDTATKVAQWETYAEAAAAAARIAGQPWLKVRIVSMRRPGNLAELHAQHLDDARTWRKLAMSPDLDIGRSGLKGMARESIEAARAVRIGMA